MEGILFGAPEQTLLKLLDYIYKTPNEMNLDTSQLNIKRTVPTKIIY